MRGVAYTACLIAITSPPLAAQDDVDNGRYSMLLSTGAGRFEGEYGQPDKTTFDVLNVSGRWYLPRGEIEVSIPYLRVDGDVRFVGGQPVPGEPRPGARRTESGVGDAVLQGEYYLHTGTDTSPWVIGLLRLKLPTGDEDRGLGTGATDIEVGVGFIQRRGPLNWLADVGYTAVGSSADFDLKDVVRVGGGVSRPFGADERSSAYLYLENRTNIVEGLDDRRSLALGVETSLDDAQRLRVSGSLFFGLSDSAEDFGLYLTLGRRY